MDSLNRVADRLESAAGVFATARPGEFAPAPGGVGSDDPGLLGEVMLALRQQRAAALHARAQEATAAAGRLGRLAADLRTAASRYGGVDQQAARSVRGTNRE